MEHVYVGMGAAKFIRNISRTVGRVVINDKNVKGNILVKDSLNERGEIVDLVIGREYNQREFAVSHKYLFHNLRLKPDVYVKSHSLTPKTVLKYNHTACRLTGKSIAQVKCQYRHVKFADLVNFQVLCRPGLSSIVSSR